MTEDQRNDAPGLDSGEARAVERNEAWGTTPAFNASKYREHVDDLDLTEEEKLDFLQTVWSIMVAFVDLGFRVDSVTQILSAFAEASSNSDSDALKERDRNGKDGGAPGAASAPREVSHEP